MSFGPPCGGEMGCKYPEPSCYCDDAVQFQQEDEGRMEGTTMQRAYMPQAKSTEHETPPDLFDALNREFGPFTLDPACRNTDYTALRIISNGGTIHTLKGGYDTSGWYGPEDGLSATWSGRVFLNPPYGREMPKWIEKAVSEVEVSNCELVVALIPSRTDTRMWQKFILREVDFSGGLCTIAGHDSLQLVRFLPGRLHFSGQKDPAPFPSAIVVWAR